MLTERRSPEAWFKIWSRIVKEKKEVTRLELSELSKASLWTIKSMARDFCEYEAHINYKNGKFVYWTPRLEQTLSTLSNEQRSKMV